MNPITNVAYSVWTRFLGTRECKLLQLPEEIIVDEIFQYLTVYDIMRLRVVCKPLSVMTKKAAVWKRLLPYLSQIDQPLAPLPPTKAYNMRNLTAHDMETVVSRAISYDSAWKKEFVKPFSHFGGLAFHKTTDMTLLPGGHFLVSAVEYMDHEFGHMHVLHLWCLQHPATNRPAIIAYRCTESPPYGLTAKYMTIRGEKGIAVAFVRRKNKDPKDERKVPRSFELGGKMDPEDPYQPLKYECTVLHMPMFIVDVLTDRHVAPQTPQFAQRVYYMKSHLKRDIWNVVSRIRTGSQLGSVSLDRIDDEPYVCLLKRPNTLVFQRLDDEVRSSLQLRHVDNYFQAPHLIYNFRVLPEQNHVLVVRNIEKVNELEMKNDHTAIELYTLPDPEEHVVLASSVDFRIIDKEDYINVQISETYRKMPTHEDDSITPYLSQDHMQPISIYLRTELSMVHYALYPFAVDPPPSPPDTPQSSSQSQNQNKLVKTPQRIFIYDLSRSISLDFTVDDDEDDEGRSDIVSNDKVETEEEIAAAERGEWILPAKVKKDDALRFLPGASRCVFYQIPRTYRSIDPPVTGIFAYQLNEYDRGFFDFVSPMDLHDALGFGDMVNIGVRGWERDDMTETEREELEVIKSIAPGAKREREKIIHPSLAIPAKKVKNGRAGMVPMDLPARFKTMIAHGVHAMAFDEDVGRLVVATKNDRKLHVFDFAYRRKMDENDIELAGAMDKAMNFEMELCTD